MLAEVYTPEHDPLAMLERRDRAAISVYAQGRDYHDVVKKRLKRLGRWLIAAAEQHQGSELSSNPLKSPAGYAARQGGSPEIKVFVDTAPVMEKPLAAGGGTGLAGQAYQSVWRVTWATGSFSARSSRRWT